MVSVILQSGFCVTVLWCSVVGHRPSFVFNVITAPGASDLGHEFPVPYL